MDRDSWCTDRCLSGASAIHVAATGSNDSSCGDQSGPCATIEQGIDRSQTGDTVCVHAGTYHESWLAPKSGTWLVSADGPGQASIFLGDQSAVRLTDIVDAGISGFEVHGSWNQGSPGDGLIRALNATAVPTTTHPALERIAEIKAGFVLSGSSPAAGAGVDAIQQPGHPNWRPGSTDRRWDFEQQPRPSGGNWDLGVDQVP